MIGITSDLLDVEALRLGRLRIRPAPTDARSVLTGCTKVSRPDAKCTLLVADDVPDTIDVDSLRFRQVQLPRLPTPHVCCLFLHVCLFVRA